MDNDEVREMIRKEIDGPRRILGYRALWHTFRLKYRMCVPRARVQELLEEIDPVRTEQRKCHSLKRREHKSADQISADMLIAMIICSHMDYQFMVQ